MENVLAVVDGVTGDVVVAFGSKQVSVNAVEVLPTILTVKSR